jgi:hypothetical protein
MDDDAVDTEQYDVEIPPGWKTVRRMALDCGVAMGTIRRHYKEYKTLPFRRLSDGRIIVNANEAPIERIKGAHRHRRMMDEARQEIVPTATAEPTDDDYSAVQVIRRHVRWLEQTIEELQNRHAEYERERRRMEQAHRAECQQLLAIISSLTNATQTPASSPRRSRRKATEAG